MHPSSSIYTNEKNYKYVSMYCASITYWTFFSPVIKVLLKDNGNIFTRHVDNMLIRSIAVATQALHQLTVSGACSTIDKGMDI